MLFCRGFRVGNNNLVGIVPPSVTKFGAAVFNLNCLSGYSTQPWCPLPYVQQQALTDLYASASGQWWRHGWSLQGDPCLTQWFGVVCDATNTVVTYVQLQYLRSFWFLYTVL
jgi:hypothetical protein